MSFRLALGVVLVLAVLVAACGGGGGGGGDKLSTYEQKHLTGTWTYTCTEESGSNSFSGQMTIDSAGNIVGLTNTLCTQLATGYMYVTTNLEYIVRGRNYAWCTDTSDLMKFALDFVNTKYLTGIMDYHPSSGGYTRYTMEMRK
jgi:hypothetical protein